LLICREFHFFNPSKLFKFSEKWKIGEKNKIGSGKILSFFRGARLFFKMSSSPIRRRIKTLTTELDSLKRKRDELV
jgi:hypothetical protein